nr:uncharacterized protein LOC129164606 [Nothobranchius furzeri]
MPELRREAFQSFQRNFWEGGKVNGRCHGSILSVGQHTATASAASDVTGQRQKASADFSLSIGPGSVKTAISDQKKCRRLRRSVKPQRTVSYGGVCVCVWGGGCSTIFCGIWSFETAILKQHQRYLSSLSFHSASQASLPGLQTPVVWRHLPESQPISMRSSLVKMDFIFDSRRSRKKQDLTTWLMWESIRSSGSKTTPRKPW